MGSGPATPAHAVIEGSADNTAAVLRLIPQIAACSDLAKDEPEGFYRKMDLTAHKAVADLARRRQPDLQEEAACGNHLIGNLKLCAQLVIMPRMAQSNGRTVPMNNLIWLVGAVVIVLAILSFFGFR
ncbi:hypothetical protein [Rhizobium vallis]|nr:hypothetical protein [Rhizobium vallis]